MRRRKKPLKPFILFYVVSGSSHQCQLLLRSNCHETRGGRSNFQLLWRLRRSLHIHLYQLSERGLGESQGVPGTVMCLSLTRLGKWSKIRKTYQASGGVPLLCVLAAGNIFAFCTLCYYLFGRLSRLKKKKKKFYIVFVLWQVEIQRPSTLSRNKCSMSHI